jgi:hypothetical protein
MKPPSEVTLSRRVAVAADGDGATVGTADEAAALGKVDAAGLTDAAAPPHATTRSARMPKLA